MKHIWHYHTSFTSMTHNIQFIGLTIYNLQILPGPTLQVLLEVFLGHTHELQPMAITHGIRMELLSHPSRTNGNKSDQQEQDLSPSDRACHLCHPCLSYLSSSFPYLSQIFCALRPQHWQEEVPWSYSSPGCQTNAKDWEGLVTILLRILLIFRFRSVKPYHDFLP